MTDQEREELKRRIAVETHMLNGGNIEALSKIYPENRWYAHEGIDFRWKEFHYRIVEPKKRKIKLEAWRNPQGKLLLLTDDQVEFLNITPRKWIHLPALDQYVEIEE